MAVHDVFGTMGAWVFLAPIETLIPTDAVEREYHVNDMMPGFIQGHGRSRRNAVVSRESHHVT
jgi:hypothetical protein